MRVELCILFSSRRSMLPIYETPLGFRACRRRCGRRVRRVGHDTVVDSAQRYSSLLTYGFMDTREDIKKVEVPLSTVRV